MAGFRAPEERRFQMVLFPERLDDVIPADHLVRHVLALFESEALSGSIQAMERVYDLARGRPPYHPRYMAALYVYGMLTGYRSSRQLEDACHNRIDVRYLMECQRPDHATIAEFVVRHGSELQGLLRDTLTLGRRAGVLKLSRVALDGTKLKARGSKGSILRRARIERELEEADREVARLSSEYEENERRESLTRGLDWGGDPDKTPAQQKRRFERQQRALQAALAEFSERQKRSARGSSRVQEQVSVTDPEARGMAGKDGCFGLHYNAQVAVDVDSGMVVAVDLNDETGDAGQLIPMVEEIERNCGEKPEAVLADSAYGPGPDLTALEEAGIEGFIAVPEGESIDEEALAAQRERIAGGEILTVEEVARMPRGRNGRLHRLCFHYREEEDVYVCPLGARLRFVRTQTQRLKGRKVKRRTYESEDCSRCPLLASCCGGSKKVRTITRDRHEGSRQRLRHRMSSERGREIYRARAPSVEGRIALMTAVTGRRRVSRFGRAGAKLEWSLAAIATNIRVLVSAWQLVKPII
ncbi:MAG: IS1182 family transposase [Planctomycetes bacterium]|nr:IS1182 family transposase [Planctomycetota bacterium]